LIAFAIWFYPKRNNTLSEVALFAEWNKDFYLTISEPLQNGFILKTAGQVRELRPWSGRIQIKPFIRFIWLGCLLIAAGGIISFIRKYFL
jgi:cytochrome c-type biogenesis protein CcmF